MSDIACTVAVLENSKEVWDQEYNKKKISRTEWELYMKSEDYAIKKPKYTDQKSKKREYCDLGWSKDGIEFYIEVRKWWRDIAFVNNCGIWSDLEGAWAEYAEENNFGNMYSQNNTRHDISSNTPDYEEAQEEELPDDHFCVRDEMNNCPWKENKTHEDNEDGSDYDNECSGPRKRAKEGNHCLPRVSTGSDMTALSQHESEEECGGISDREGDRWCGI
jgi:hypothetical protein